MPFWIFLLNWRKIMNSLFKKFNLVPTVKGVNLSHSRLSRCGPNVNTSRGK